MACGFVYIDGVDLPAVNGVTLTPAYITDAERTLSGMLRVEHTETPREWRVVLRNVTGSDMATLLPFLADPAPREVIVMGASTTAAVFVDQVEYNPLLSQPQDLGRANVTITIREILAGDTPTPPVIPTADATTVRADTSTITADAA